MVKIEDVVGVATAAPRNMGWERPGWIRAELDKLGASDADIVTAALEGMADADRNMRVKMLRVLAAAEDARATAAVLAALSDPARRVRDVAIKATRPHHLSAEVIERLRGIVDDEQEIAGLRREAFLVLSTSVAREELPEVATEAALAMLESPRFRTPMLVRLCKLAHHSPTSRAVLQSFVDNGSKDEAVMATRALCGHMLVRVDGWLPSDVRRRVRDTYDPAPDALGVPSCWIPRDDALALAAEVGYPGPP